jgi:hypothetical protein
MLLKILLVGALVAGGMAVLKDGNLLRRAGLVGSCAAVSAPASDQTLQRCRKGRLDGYPDLQKKSCESIYFRGGYQYWRCAAPIVVSESPRG